MVSSNTKTEKAKNYGLTPTQMDEAVEWDGDDFRIHYYNPATKKKTGMYRTRHSGRDKNKYTQPAGTLPEAYYFRKFGWKSVLEDAGKEVLLTEGEMKSVKACVEGFACVGLGGVFNFASRKHGIEWLPSLDLMKWKERKVYIAFDSDARDNPMVQLAETRLVLLLMERGAEVHVLRLPAQADGTKTGLDDYLIGHGKAGLQKLMEQAKPWNKDSPLLKMNEEVVLVENPMAVVRLDDLHMMDPHRGFIGVIYADRKHTAGTGEDAKPVDTAKAWLKWPGRNKVSGVTFEPGAGLFVEKNGKRLLNTWKGWGAEPVQGDVTVYRELMDRIFGHLPEEQRKWARQWFAYPIQHPGAKLHTAMVLCGGQGTGKSLTAGYHKELYGDAGAIITQIELESAFNDWIESKAYVQGEEVTTKESKRSVANMLKFWITGRTVPISKKFIPRFELPNKVNLCLTTNYHDALYLDGDDRRAFVVEAKCESMTKEEGKYFGEWIEKQENKNALMWHLLNEVDCSDFSPGGHALMTEAKEEMIAANRTELEDWVLRLKENPDATDLTHRDYRDTHHGTKLPDEVTPTQLLFAMQGRFTKYKPGTMGRALKHAGFEQKTVRVGKSSERRYVIREPGVSPKADRKARDGGATAPPDSPKTLRKVRRKT